MRIRILKLLLVCLLFLISITIYGKDKKEISENKHSKVSITTTEAEEKICTDACKEIEKYYKLVSDKDMVDRATNIADTLAPVSERSGVIYTCKVLDVPGEYNAMSIPGGAIYITSGLMNAVESDDELAGVIAHEIAHNSMSHFARQNAKSSKYSAGIIAAVLAGVLLGSQSDVDLSSVLATGSVMYQALKNGYTVELEREADIHAVEYMVKSGKYSPSGLYTVMLGFKQLEDSRAPAYYGYLSNHPPTLQRMKTIELEMKREKYPINIWSAIPLRASAKYDDITNTSGLFFGDGLIYTFKDFQNSLVEDRAQRAVDNFNRILTSVNTPTVKVLDVTYKVHDEAQADIIVSKNVIFTIDATDSDNKNIKEVAKSITDNIKSVIINESIKRGVTQ